MSDDKNFNNLLLQGMQDMKQAQEKTTESVNGLTTEVKLHKQESTQRWEAVEATNETQNKLLEEHKATGEAQAERNKIEREKIRQTASTNYSKLDGRVYTLEEPEVLKKQMKAKIKSTLGWFMSIAGAIILLMKLLDIL